MHECNSTHSENGMDTLGASLGVFIRVENGFSEESRKEQSSMTTFPVLLFQ